jgi:hypothetical protein
MRSRPPSAFSILPLLCVTASTAWAQNQAGPEFRVNTYTTGAQSRASVTHRSDGSWMVAWETVAEDGSSTGVWGKHYDRFGVIHGPEFQCNTYTTGFQGGPSITTGIRSGVVVWHSLTQDGSGSGVYGQRLNATHGNQGAEFRVNSFTAAYQYGASVDMSPAGHFVVAWSSYNQDGSNDAIVARRFDIFGAPATGEVIANTYTTGEQTEPAVAADAAGNFVVVWQSAPNQDGGRDGIFGQRFNAAGGRIGVEFRVNTYTLNYQQYPDIAMSPDGRFVVVWQSLAQEGAGWGIYAQRYSAAGAPLGVEMHINGFTTNDQTAPAIGIDDEANFVITWESFTQDGDQGGVFARRFDAAGNPRGQFRVNTTTVNDQFDPSIGVDPVGNFMVVWTGTGQDGSDLGVFGQRFGGLLPAPALPGSPPAMIVDPAGNGVFEPGETVATQPAWENVGNAAQSVTGTLANFTGPAGATYIIADGAANYGIINPNIIQRCTFTGNCYSLTVTTPQTRPVLHWDATAVETLAPVDLGQVKKWSLHLGDSFADVPRTSPFYRFVETLLHTGVTAGCAGNNYCPSNPVTREAMAVFVLLAKEGPGYLPPPCVTPVFADVPPSSPFCRYIEELFRRGIAGGCATNPLRYCPGNVVTREQMSVFLLRTLDPAINPPACTTKPFDDVPIDSPFCRWITELVDRGITGGCSPENYCPTATVTRDQMGVFLTVTFSLLLYGPA